MLAGLNDAQRQAVITEAAPLAILAGAGSGKTRVLTRRIARRVLSGEVDHRRVLAVTFTRKAAAELRDRLNRLELPGPVHAGTFHGIAYSQLRQRWTERGITPPALLDRKVGFIARLMSAKNSTAPLDVTSEIEWAKARMISADRYVDAATRAARNPPVSLEIVARIYGRYEEEKLRRRMVDFDDLLRLATRDIVRDPEYAAAQRWRHRHLFVDEFQDVNPLQFELLSAWVGDSADLCVVGDPNQAIYAWNGADASYLSRFDEYFGGAEFVELAMNYRSTPQILGVANTVLGAGIDIDVDQQRAPLRLVPTKGDGELPTLRSFVDETAEARAIARQIRDAHAPGTPWSHQAVLVRTNAQLTVFEEALSTAGIPFRSRSGARLLDLPEVRDALSGLRRGPGILREKLRELEQLLRPVDSTPLAADAEDQSAATTRDIEPEEFEPDDEPSPNTPMRRNEPAPLNAERSANVVELVRLGTEYLDLDPEGTLSGFEAWLTSTLRIDDGLASRDAVELATFHAAKGLEWPIVYLAGLEEGFVPIHYASTQSARAEERRLLYVALTRAERLLRCSWCSQRTFGTRTARRSPSPYLESIELALELLSDRSDPVDLAAAVSAQRAKLRAADGQGPVQRRTKSKKGAAEVPPHDQALMDALRAWRLEHARAADVPAFVIFNDATLSAVASARPANAKQLLAVAGIGAVKAQRFGPDVLEIVAKHAPDVSVPLS